MSRSATVPKTYQGVIIPMVTPITPDGGLDEAAVRRLLDHLIMGGVQGIFLLGTTGEGPSTPREIRSRLVHMTLEYVNERVQVYAGIPDTVAQEAVDAGRDYLRRGVAAVVAPLPSYFTLTRDEQFHYYANLARRIPGPILLYDIPAAVHMSIDPHVIEHLRAFPNVVGVKDSSGDEGRLLGLIESYSDDPAFTVLVGTTSLASFGLRRGADGFVPSIGNLQPSLCARLYQASRNGDDALMNSLQSAIDAAQAECAGETLGRGIACLKRQLHQRGICGPNVFLPLQEDLTHGDSAQKGRPLGAS